jgi:hypothetical protein
MRSWHVIGFVALMCSVVSAASAGGIELDAGDSAAIAGVIAVIGQIALRVIFKKLKVTKKAWWQKALWGAASALFGDGVEIENNADRKDVAKLIEGKSPVLAEAAKYLKRFETGVKK